MRTKVSQIFHYLHNCEHAIYRWREYVLECNNDVIEYKKIVFNKISTKNVLRKNIIIIFFCETPV